MATSKLKTILSDIGNVFKKIFQVGEKVAEAVEPEIDILFPGIATLFNASVVIAAKTEAAAEAADAQSGTGAQKLASASAQIEPLVISYLKDNNLTTANTTVTAGLLAQAAVNVLNAFSPAPAAGAPAPTPAPATIGA